MIIPDIVLAIALLSFFTMLKLTMGLHTIILAHVVFNLAFVCSVVRARLKSFDWSIVEASADLGAAAVTTFRRVTLPVILPAVIAGALLAFTLSVDEFIIAYFTAGAGARLDHPADADLRDDPLRRDARDQRAGRPSASPSPSALLALSQRLNRPPEDGSMSRTCRRSCLGNRIGEESRRSMSSNLSLGEQRVLRPARPVRLRQDDAPAHDRRLRDSHGGRIPIDGERHRQQPANRRPVNMMFQSYALFPHMSGRAECRLWPRGGRLPREEVRRRVGESWR